MDPCSLERKPLLTVAEALARILAAVKPLQETEILALGQSLGRVLAQPVYAAIPLPYERNAAMDGYALNSQAIQAQPFGLTLAGTSWAGKPYQGTAGVQNCVRIFTGAVVPAFADTVVIQELVEAGGDQIHFPSGLLAGENIRAAGEDVQVGQMLCAVGKKLSATDLGFLAAAGVASLAVKRLPKIVFFATGDELLSLGETITSGKIYDSNSYLLAALLTEQGYQADNGGILADDADVLLDTLTAAANHYDVIITTGGASVGDADHIQTVLRRCGQVDFWKLAIKPGKPLAFGNIGACHFFGLPGNPAAVQITFQQLLAPALVQLSGADVRQPLRIKATCTTALKKQPGRLEFQRGVLSQDSDGNFSVSASSKQGSHILSTLSIANCVIILAADCSGVAIGEVVMVEPYAAWL
jgi:molybdopterin molybdotransferase